MRYLATIRWTDGAVIQTPTDEPTAKLDGHGIRSVLITEPGNGSMLVDSWYADRDAELLIDQ